MLFSQGVAGETRHKPKNTTLIGWAKLRVPVQCIPTCTVYTHLYSEYPPVQCIPTCLVYIKLYNVYPPVQTPEFHYKILLFSHCGLKTIESDQFGLLDGEKSNFVWTCPHFCLFFYMKELSKDKSNHMGWSSCVRSFQNNWIWPNPIYGRREINFLLGLVFEKYFDRKQFASSCRLGGCEGRWVLGRGKW